MTSASRCQALPKNIFYKKRSGNLCNRPKVRNRFPGGIDFLPRGAYYLFAVNRLLTFLGGYSGFSHFFCLIMLDKGERSPFRFAKQNEALFVFHRALRVKITPFQKERK
jgi:hypothetical protein